jgi:elongation factor Ts
VSEYQPPAEEVKKLRDATGAGMMDCKRALQESRGDVDGAVELLRKKGLDRARGRAGRQATEGVIQSYIHFNGRVGVLVEVNCETDFVANTDEFKQLAKDVALHIASARPRWLTRDQIPTSDLEQERKIYEAQAGEQGKPANVVERIVEGKLNSFFKETVLLDQAFVRDDAKTVGELADEVSAKVGEKVAIRRFARFELGEELD